MQEVIETIPLTETSQGDGIAISYFGSIFSDMWLYADDMEITVTKQLPHASGRRTPPQVARRSIKGNGKIHRYGVYKPLQKSMKIGLLKQCR